MAKEKGKFFNVYLDHFKAILELSDRKRGQLMAALILYAETGEVTEGYTGLERVCYDTLRGDIDRSFRNYQKTCERNRQSSLRRWRSDTEIPVDGHASERMPAHAYASECMPAHACASERMPAHANSNSNSNSNPNNNSNPNSNPDPAPGSPAADGPSLPSALNGAALFDQILRGDDDALQSFRMR